MYGSRVGAFGIHGLQCEVRKPYILRCAMKHTRSLRLPCCGREVEGAILMNRSPKATIECFWWFTARIVCGFMKLMVVCSKQGVNEMPWPSSLERWSVLFDLFKPFSLLVVQKDLALTRQSSCFPIHSENKCAIVADVLVHCSIGFSKGIAKDLTFLRKVERSPVISTESRKLPSTRSSDPVLFARLSTVYLHNDVVVTCFRMHVCAFVRSYQRAIVPVLDIRGC